jgi:hypothetical protein
VVRLDLAWYWYVYFNEKRRGYTWLGTGICTLLKSGEVRPGLVLVHVLSALFIIVHVPVPSHV